ncbi:carbohydrate ABC transporter permease [Bacilliculturomica massiliensis]|uniref:carbohydrate ABC transporter permease n=1 Tax=Bacilliculturomica massiliensis TaxID=1917867 RepID=UPI0010317E7E|nr:carbohydrate ABC transporter permease [Bacilliculturomica massiliensis]
MSGGKGRIRTGILLVIAAVVCMPLVMLIGGSFMGGDEIAEKIGPVLAEREGRAEFFLFPQYPTLQGFVELLLDSPEFFAMFWNTCRIVFPILAGQLLIAAPAAWGFAKYRFRGKKALFTLYIALMLMPFQVTMVSNYLVLSGLHLLDTRLSVILPAIFSTFPVFIICRFFQGVPDALLEAASLDGAGPWQTFFYIGLPMGAPGIASALLLSFLEYWNVLEQPLTFLKDRSLWPLSLYLPNIVSEKAAVSLAASLIMLIPPLLVFLMGQKYLESGIRAAGLKE